MEVCWELILLASQWQLLGYNPVLTTGHPFPVRILEKKEKGRFFIILFFLIQYFFHTAGIFLLLTKGKMDRGGINRSSGWGRREHLPTQIAYAPHPQPPHDF